MRYVRLKHTALLFIACYLSACFGAMAADFCLDVRMQQCPTTLAKKDGCCAEIIEAVPTQGQPCGACYDHCDSHDHQDFYVISVPAVKRVSHSPLVVGTTSQALSGLQVAQYFPPTSVKKTNLPNSALAALRTVVLLN